MVNSFKRLNHETVEKATHWYRALGANGVVCAGLLSGVYSVDNLVSAQREDVSLFWSHDLGCIGEFIKSTYPSTIELQPTGR
ncbi:MAG: XamI family restriction endonuclease [Atopobiaceae bacterium]|nr:XamI family restriction endonuclease [Atopobiaceae bacterium]